MSYEGNEATIVYATKTGSSDTCDFMAENLVIPSYVYDSASTKIYKITKIGKFAFYIAANYGADQVSGSLYIPDTITSIDKSAFFTSKNISSSRITSVRLPSNISLIGADAFANQELLNTIDFSGNEFYKLTDPSV